METFSMNAVIEEITQEFLEKHGNNTSSIMLIEGLNYGDYFVLRKTGRNYNFVSFSNNNSTYLQSSVSSKEDCIKQAIRDGKEIRLFEDLEEFCKWYLTDGKRSFGENEYQIIETKK